MEKNSTLVRIGEEILQARKDKKLSQTKLAEISFLSQAQISQIERGEVNMQLSSLSRILDALSMDVTLKDKGVQNVNNSVSFYDVEKDKTISRINGNVTMIPAVGELIILQGQRYRVSNRVFKQIGRNNSCLISVKCE